MEKDNLKVEHHIPRWWWLHPTFDFGLKYPAPYIWFGYWLITWDDFSNPWKKFDWRDIKIKFLPD